jgi:DNA-binding transcriptional LysR family regulator
VLIAHVDQGGWATILPSSMGGFLAVGKALRVIPISPSSVKHSVGLVAPYREPHTPVLQALIQTARGLSESKSP